MTGRIATDLSWRRSNLGHLLFAGAAACASRKLAVVQAAGFADVTEAQLSLFQALPRKGARLTDLASSAGLAKQSMIELVDRAERQGYVERASNEADGRAKTVSPTRRGKRLVHMAASARMLDTAAIERLGAIDDTGLLETLAAYGGAPATAPAERVLGDAARRFVSGVLAAVHEHGYRDVSEAMIGLFRTLEIDGGRLTLLAARARITKQSMLTLASRAERLGLVERSADPADSRAKIIRFTDAGLTMLEQMRRGVAASELAFALANGDSALSELKRRLKTYLDLQPRS